LCVLLCKNSKKDDSAASSATVSAAVTAAIAAALPLLLFVFWLIFVCPHAASSIATVGLPPPLPLLAADTIVTVAASANHCPLLLLQQPLPVFLDDVQNITLDQGVCQPPHCCRGVRRQHCKLPVLDDDGRR